MRVACCISFDSYIKPQLVFLQKVQNVCCISFDSYIKPQLKNDRARPMTSCISFDSYIKPQLCGSAHGWCWCCISFDSYIKPQLTARREAAHAGCISFDSYIKPQPYRRILRDSRVVYLLIPTSNHNYGSIHTSTSTLYIFWFLHQTTTSIKEDSKQLRCISFDSYIKPQPWSHYHCHSRCCISFDSYIKPQP